MQKKSAHRAYHHGDLKASLIVSALALVKEKGPRGFTLNETSRRAGVGVSAPYNHFKDKEALLVEIVLEGNRTLETELRLAAESRPTDRAKLLAVYLAYVTFANKHPDLFAVMFQSGIDKTKHPDVRAAAWKAFDVGLELAVRIEGDSLKGQELALAIWTMAHGFASLAAEHAMAGLIATSKVTETVERLGKRLLSA